MIKKQIKRLIGTGTQAKIAKGIFWSFLGTITSKGFVTIAFFYIARILSVEDYGKIGMLRSFITTFTFLSLASFGTTVNKYIAVLRGKDLAELSRVYSLTRMIVFALALILGTILFLFPSFFAETIVGDVDMYNEVKIGAFIIFFSAMNGFQNGALAGFENFKAISIVNIINGIVSLPTIIVLAYYYGVIGVMYALFIVYFLLWVTSAFFLQKEVKKNQLTFTIKYTNKELRILWLFSLPSFLNSLMISPVILWCNNILIKKATNGYEEMGYYSAAYSLSLLIMTLNTVIGDVFFPYAMKFFKSENKKFDFYNILMPWFIGVVICIPILLFPDIIALLYGKNYENSQMYNTLIIVLLFTVIVCQRQGISRNIAAANLMWLAVLDNVFWAFIAVSSCYFLSKYGAVGRASAFLIAYLLNTIFFLPIYLHKKLIDKSLILTNYNALIILFLIFSLTGYYFFADYLIIRVLILILNLFMIMYVFYLWVNKINLNEKKVS